jgi:hypothetical protein
MQKYDNSDLTWRGERLVLRAGGRAGPVVELVPDSTYPGMWRIRTPDGSLSDMLNRTRARDAARSILLGLLRQRLTPQEAPPMRSAA